MNKFEIADSELITRYKNGDESAFEILVLKYKSRLFTTIQLIVKDQYVAEDLLQETFIKAIDTIRSGKYNEEGKFLPWISRIGYNMAIDHFRKQKRYPSLAMEENSPFLNSMAFSEDSAEAIRIKNETFTKLRELIQRLPEAQREVLVMRQYMKMSFQEIAEATGVSINTALGRMRYALINLRKQLEKSNTPYDTIML